MSDKPDLRDMMLEAITEVRVVFRDVMMEATEPMVEQQLRQTWSQMPQELKDRMANERPEEYAMLIKHIGAK